VFERVATPTDKSTAAVTRPTRGFGADSLPGLQRKIVVGPADDPLEREADRIADAVVADGAASAGAGASPAGAAVQRKCATCDDEETMQGKDAVSPGPVSPAVSESVAASAGQGRPLSSSERSFFDGRFGHRFEAVRIHDGERDARLSAAVGARAFTYGQDIFLGRGQYAPDSLEGRRLLAHELTHTLQQGGGASSAGTAPATTDTTPGDAR
jgi:hypothetical protein